MNHNHIIKPYTIQSIAAVSKKLLKTNDRTWKTIKPGSIMYFLQDKKQVG